MGWFNHQRCGEASATRAPDEVDTTCVTWVFGTDPLGSRSVGFFFGGEFHTNDGDFPDEKGWFSTDIDHSWVYFGTIGLRSWDVYNVWSAAFLQIELWKRWTKSFGPVKHIDSYPRVFDPHRPYIHKKEPCKFWIENWIFVVFYIYITYKTVNLWFKSISIQFWVLMVPTLVFRMCVCAWPFPVTDCVKRTTSHQPWYVYTCTIYRLCLYTLILLEPAVHCCSEVQGTRK